MSKKARNQRKAARDKVHDVIRVHGSTCYWCRCELTVLKDIPAGRVRWVTDRKVCWTTKKGTVLTRRIASIDHLKALKDGGGNRLSNLVPSCIDCNMARHAEDPQLKDSILKDVYDQGQRGTGDSQRQTGGGNADQG